MTLQELWIATTFTHEFEDGYCKHCGVPDPHQLMCLQFQMFPSGKVFQTLNFVRPFNVWENGEQRIPTPLRNQDGEIAIGVFFVEGLEHGLRIVGQG